MPDKSYTNIGKTYVNQSFFRKRISINGRAMMAIVALTGRYTPKLTCVTTRYVVSSSPIPMADEMR